MVDGFTALREIRHWQRSSELLIPRLPFSRLCKEIASQFRLDIRMQAVALAALQEAAECMLAMWFEMLYYYSRFQLCTDRKIDKLQQFMQSELRLCRRTTGWFCRFSVHGTGTIVSLWR